MKENNENDRNNDKLRNKQWQSSNNGEKHERKWRKQAISNENMKMAKAWKPSKWFNRKYSLEINEIKKMKKYNESRKCEKYND